MKMRYLAVLLFLNITALFAQSENWVFLKTETAPDSSGVIDYYIDESSVVSFGNASTLLRFKAINSNPNFDEFDNKYAQAFIEEIMITCGEKFYKRNFLKILYTDGSDYTVHAKYDVKKTVIPGTIIAYIYELRCAQNR